MANNTRTGIGFLPPAVSNKEMIDIYKTLTRVRGLIGSLKGELKHAPVGPSIISMFSLYESVQSTRIEGTQITFLEMVEPTSKKGWEQIEVLNYQKALRQGIDQIHNGMPFSTRLIQSLHKTLMEDARGTSSAGGVFRRIQNFIGTDNKIEHAVYIPVSAETIPNYMENLEYYVNGIHHNSFKHYNEDDKVCLDETIDPLIKLAIMHAQFESIHPFLDGNGRVGRILIALMAIKYNLVDAPIFLVSEQLEKQRERYYSLLNGVRGDNPDWYSWIKFFVDCCEKMVDILTNKITKSNKLANIGLEKCTMQSEKSAWLYTFLNPFCKVSDFANYEKITTSTARKALNSLVDKKLIFCDMNITRNRIYRNYDLLEILNP